MNYVMSILITHCYTKFTQCERIGNCKVKCELYYIEYGSPLYRVCVSLWINIACVNI